MRLPEFMGPSPHKEGFSSHVERLAPSVFRFRVWSDGDCQDMIDYLESFPDEWATPETADRIAKRPEVIAAFPPGFDLAGLVKRRKIREFPLYAIPGFQRQWEAYSREHIMPLLGRLWGRDLTGVIAPFVFCYQRRAGLKSSLRLHYDSFNTFVLPLAHPDSYAGGGTVIPDLDVTINDVRGHAHVFPGLSSYTAPSLDTLACNEDDEVELHPELWHSTRAVSRGKRYCLIGFYR